MSDKQQDFGFDEKSPSSPEQQERDRVREEYRARLAEKLKDPEFRKIEGFPIGTDEAILALSDPPHKQEPRSSSELSSRPMTMPAGIGIIDEWRCATFQTPSSCV